MKIFSSLIAVILFAAIFFALGYWTKLRDSEVKETETKFKYLKPANNLEELQKAFDTQLKILTKLEANNWIKIIASDEYKYAEKKIKISLDKKKNTIYVNYGFKTKQLLYYRSFGNFQVGGGILYPFDAVVGAGYNF